MKNSKENSFQLRYDNAFRIRFRHHDFTKVLSWKSGGEEEVASTCSVRRGYGLPCSISLFSRGRQSKPLERGKWHHDRIPSSLFLWPQLYKDLNNLEWSMVVAQYPVTDLLTTAILYTTDANPPFSQLPFDTVPQRDKDVPQRPHARFIKALQVILFLWEIRPKDDWFKL